MSQLVTSRLKGACLLFDLDGTLVETAPDLVGALNTVLAEVGLPSLPFAQVRGMVGQGAAALLIRGFAAEGVTLEGARKSELVDRFIAIYRQRIAQESLPYPGCVAALTAAKAHGAKLVVCTNKPSDLAEALIKALALDTFFEAIIGPDRALARKPDPRHVLAALQSVGGNPAKSLMIGDSDNDIDAARAAGVRSIVVSFGYSDRPVHDLGADLVVDHFDALIPGCLALLPSCPPNDREL